MLAFLAANLRKALLIRELAEAGVPREEIARRPGLWWKLVERTLASGRAADIVRALLVLRRLDLELKSARDAEAAFEAALLEIAGASPPRSSAAG